MGYNPENPCPLCKSAMHENIPLFSWTWVCRGCGNRFDNQQGRWEYTEYPKGYTSQHRTTANVWFGWLKAIFSKMTKVTSYIRKRCVKY